ncbi:MAG: hypothetical protein JRI71_04410 [Deltaproteobacteria bacterium]|nr:hypothetical protein [Deltaproteobacteria bacterium]
MNDKDKDNLRDRLKKCIRGTHVYVAKEHRLIFPIFNYSLLKEVIALIKQKLKDILDVYDENDIWPMICCKIVPFLNYDELRKKISNDTDSKFFEPVGQLPDLLNESKFIEIANNVIEELLNPTKSYALVHLPNVEPGENIRINNGLFLIADLVQDTGENFFKIDDDKIGDFDFLLENKTTYLLIEQAGWNWRMWGSEQPLVYKNILQKLKTFLGLSIIKGIFKTIRIPVSESKEKRIAYQLGVFSSVEWYEGMPADCDNPISEDHPDFNDILDVYSEGDELREFCFQKRFFIEDEINLSQIYVDLLNSLTIPEYPTKPSFDQKKGKIVELFTDSEKLESPGQFLRKKFDNVRIILNSNDDYAERVKAASLWYLEGYCTESDTFKFIDYTIAVESLLGPKDEKKDKKRKHKENIPLTQILSNRCGFSLGKSLKQKEEKQKEFRNIYDIRSRIVHSGEVILNKDDNEYLNKLEEMIKELISDAIDTYSPLECNDHLNDV